MSQNQGKNMAFFHGCHFFSIWARVLKLSVLSLLSMYITEVIEQILSINKLKRYNKIIKEQVYVSLYRLIGTKQNINILYPYIKFQRVYFSKLYIIFIIYYSTCILSREHNRVYNIYIWHILRMLILCITPHLALDYYLAPSFIQSII